MDWTEWLAGLHVSGEMNAGELLVGVGTLALAGFTWWLARQTRREVDTSKESLELTRESIEALDMPFVIVASQGGVTMTFTHTAAGDWWFDCRFWNLGKGPAIVTDLSIKNGGELLRPLDGQKPVAAGEVHDFSSALVTPVPAGLGDEDGTFTLRVYYRHASGARYMTTSRLQVRSHRAVCESYTRTPADENEREPEPEEPF